MSKWETPKKGSEVPKSIFDDLEDTPMNYQAQLKIIRSDSRNTMIMPHTVAVFGYDPKEEENISNLLNSVGEVVYSKKDQHCLYLTYSTHVGASKALAYHMSIIGNTRIAVELQKAENKVVQEPLQKASWLSWIGLTKS